MSLLGELLALPGKLAAALNDVVTRPVDASCYAAPVYSEEASDEEIAAVRVKTRARRRS